MAAGQNSQGLPNFKVTHADHASSLVIFRAVTGVSAMKRYYVIVIYLNQYKIPIGPTSRKVFSETMRPIQTYDAPADSA